MRSLTLAFSLVGVCYAGNPPLTNADVVTTIQVAISRDAVLAVANGGGTNPIVAAAASLIDPVGIQIRNANFTMVAVAVPYRGDDNADARAFLRYRVLGSAEWSAGPPMFRSVEQAGDKREFRTAVLNLAPATTYELQVRLVDPDGADRVIGGNATTRSFETGPVLRTIPVSTADGLQTALKAAQPGDLISVGPGVYRGMFVVPASGTTSAPVFIRGTGPDTVIEPGCEYYECWGLSVTGSNVHISDMQVRNATGAVLFDTKSQGGRVQRLVVSNASWGVRSYPGTANIYVADSTFTLGNYGIGVSLVGSGHVVEHNVISGSQTGISVGEFPAGLGTIQVVGNDIRNVGRAISTEADYTVIAVNRITNSDVPFSVTSRTGPALLFRNVSASSFEAELEFRGVADESRNVLFAHNTFLTGAQRFRVIGSGTVNGVTVENNLFVAPNAAAISPAEDWRIPVKAAALINNGYYPDGEFKFLEDYAHGIADASRSGREFGPVLLWETPAFVGVRLPVSANDRSEPQDVTVRHYSNNVDKATPIPAISSAYFGDQPDIGAVEYGCPAPAYGPRSRDMSQPAQVQQCPAPVLPPSPDQIVVLSGPGVGATDSLVPERLKIKVLRNGLPVKGYPVTLYAPNGYHSPSLLLQGGWPSLVITTDKDGVVQSDWSQSNSVLGDYTIEVHSGGAWPALIRRANVTPVSSSISVAPITVPFARIAKAVSFVVKVVTSNNAPLDGGEVDFYCPTGAPVSATLSAGQAVGTCDILPGAVGSTTTVHVVFRGWKAYSSVWTDAVATVVTAPTPDTSGVSDQTFFRAIYFGLLFRIPGAAEVNSWVEWMRQTKASRSDVIVRIFGSEEFQRKSRFIAGLYVGLLGRDPEHAGWMFQRAALVGGYSAPRLVENFLTSEEFRLKNGTLDDASFVRLLYRQIMLREPSADEVAFQVRALQRGMPRRDMAYTFLNSPEFALGSNTRLNVYLAYATLLLRVPTASETEAGATQVVSSGLPALVTSVVNSTEFAFLLEKLEKQ